MATLKMAKPNIDWCTAWFSLVKNADYRSSQIGACVANDYTAAEMDTSATFNQDLLEKECTSRVDLAIRATKLCCQQSDLYDKQKCEQAKTKLYEVNDP